MTVTSRASCGLCCALLTFASIYPVPLTADSFAWEQGSGYRVASLSVQTPGKIGFALVASNVTGITFSNTCALAKITENHNLMNGSGVAAGDFDNDGWCDLYFCAVDGTNALYRNLGGWRFQDVTSKADLGCPGMHSTGAVFADLDADGLLDLLVGTLGHGPRCFKNQGGGRFRDVTSESGLAAETGTTGFALGDVDGNGTLDLFVANYGANSLYRSGGSAQMQQVNGKWVIMGPNAERLRFVNGRIEELGEVSVLYLNDGQGHFRPVPWNSDYFLDENGKPMPPTPDFSLTVQIRDLNGDGWPDIYVCNDFASPDRIWINDGKGRFRALPTLAMRKQSASSMGVDFADLDRDGFVDFFSTEMRPRGHSRFMQDMLSVLAQARAPGSFDDRPQVARNCLLRNRGDGTFEEIAWYAGVPASDWSWQPVFLDVDLDGFEDLLIGNGMWFDVQDRDSLTRIRALGKQTLAQSRTNLLLYPHYFTSNVAWRNGHNLTFEELSTAWGFDSTLVSQGVALADLDHDGALDLAYNCFNAGPLIYRNLTAAPRIAVRLRGKDSNRQGIGASVRVFGGAVPMQMQEILGGSRYLSGDDPVRVFGGGSLSNKPTIEVSWRSGAKSTVAHARVNCLYEIDEAGGQSAQPPPQPAARPLFRDVSDLLGHTHYEQPYNDYAGQPLLMKQLSQFGPGVAWLDLDNDGHEELAIGAGRGGALEVFHRNPSGRFDRVGKSPPLPDDFCGLAFASTPEGRRILLAAMANYECEAPASSAVVSCALDRSAAGLQPGPVEGIPAWEASPGPLAVADIDGDGSLELFVGGRLVRNAYPQPASSRVFRQQNGKFLPDTENNKVLENIGLVSAAVWSDLDEDGFPELILACEWGPIRIFHNDHGRLTPWNAPLAAQVSTLNTQPSSLNQLTGWWNSVTTGDLDGDGRMDIIAGNWGLNDAYRATLEHPLRIYYGDISGGGGVDLIEAYYAPEMRAEVPRRSMGALGQAFPVLTSHFPTHEAFGSATIPQILPLLPGKAQDLEAATLVSMLFLNRGGKFLPVPLPREAQLAPVFSVNVADADGDGCEDIFLSQNFFAMRPEWERLDSGRGLWLRGDGKGGLSPIPGQDSGVMIYGEQRGAAVADFDEDGRVDLAVTQNGAQTRLYQNIGAKPGLRVRLKGPPQNPAGVGAVLRLKFGERYGPAREIHAGSGYLSQDSTVVVMATPEPPTSVWIRWPGRRQTSTPLTTVPREIVVDVKED